MLPGAAKESFGRISQPQPSLVNLSHIGARDRYGIAGVTEIGNRW
jgi:hypothetical protein